MEQQHNDIVASSGPAQPPAKPGPPYESAYGYGYGYGASSGQVAGLGGFRFDPADAFRRYWFVVVLLAVLGGSVAWFVLPHVVEPEYEARARVQVSAEVPNIIEGSQRAPDYPRFMGTQVAILKSDRNLLNTLHDEEVSKLSWVQRTTEMRALGYAKRRLTAGPIRDTELIDIRFIDYSSKEAKVFVEALVESYLAMAREEEAQARRIVRAKLEERREELRQLIERGQQSIQKINRDLGSSDVLAMQESLILQITAAEDALVQSRIEREMARISLEQLDARQDGTEEDHGALGRVRAEELQQFVASAIDADSSLNKFRERLSDAEAALDHLRLTTTEERLEVAAKTLRATIAQLNERITEREAELTVQLTERYAAMFAISERKELLNRIKMADVQERAQSEFLAMKRKELREVSQQQLTVAQIQEEQARYQLQNEAIIDRLSQLKINEGGQLSDRFSWDGYVAESPEPVPDNLNKMRLLVVGGATGLGCLIILLLTGFDTRLKRVADLQALGPVDVIGVLPRLQDLARKSGVANVGEHLSEEFRMIRTRLLHMSGFEEKNALMIASPTPGSGKTTVSVNLAALIAQAGRRVLLVDADLRKPDIHRVLDLQLNRGLSDVLQGTCKLEDAIVPVSPGLDVLTAGAAVTKPSELLAMRSVKKCIEVWCESYDLVLLDTSPLLPVSDGRVLAGVCDSALLVIRADQADRRELAETMRILSATPVQTLGVVLNGVKLRHTGSPKQRGYYAYRDAYRGRRAEGESPQPEELPHDVVDEIGATQRDVSKSQQDDSTQAVRRDRDDEV
ncbi:MAG: polysaccharide biosynthesis tyrosine autokinase [Phycisphaerales bacterium]|nr:polysaccharide biosynthesis tyrosine autokinase [Phycisphaerales bacterium]